MKLSEILATLINGLTFMAITVSLLGGTVLLITTVVSTIRHQSGQPLLILAVAAGLIGTALLLQWFFTARRP